MENELSTETHDKVKLLCSEGDSLADGGLFNEAVYKYEEALELLPPPYTRWEAATWIHAAIGDAYFLQKNYQSAVRVLCDAMKCPDAIGNPFLHLRLGQVQYELGNDILAKDELTRAYMGGGKEIFNGEDPKYFDLLTQTIKQPPGGW